MEPNDPFEQQTYTLRAVTADGEAHETEVTVAQALDVASGKAIAYWPRDEQTLVEDDGTIVHRESAVPDLPPAA